MKPKQKAAVSMFSKTDSRTMKYTRLIKVNGKAWACSLNGECSVGLCRSLIPVFSLASQTFCSLRALFVPAICLFTLIYCLFFIRALQREAALRYANILSFRTRAWSRVHLSNGRIGLSEVVYRLFVSLSSCQAQFYLSLSHPEAFAEEPFDKRSTTEQDSV